MEIWKELLEWSKILSMVLLEVEELVESLSVDDMEDSSSMLSVDGTVEMLLLLELDEESSLLLWLLV